MDLKENTTKMGTKPLWSLIISMAIPGVLGTMTTYLYRIVDQMFVGNVVDRVALSGIAVLAPFNNVVIALSLFITVGGASLLALSIGSGELERANKLFTNILVQAVGMALVVSIIFVTCAKPFVAICGAIPDTKMYDYAVVYLRIVALGQVFNMLNVGLAAIIRTEGHAKYSMCVNMIGAVCNVILDFLFVVVFSWGLEGAALATIMSQMIGALASMMYFMRGKSNLKWQGMRVVELSQMIYVAKMGIAPSIFQMLSFGTNIILNRSLQYYGDLDPVYRLIGGGEMCICAVAISTNIDQLIVSLASGINQAGAPIISYNYGAKQYKRVRGASFITQGMVLVIGIIVWAMMMMYPSFLINLFSSSEEGFIQLGTDAMRICRMFALFGGYQMLVSMYFSAIGRSDKATFVSFSRHGIFLIPALLILPNIFGLYGVLYAIPVSDACSVIVVTIMYFKEMKRLKALKDGEVICDKNIFIRTNKLRGEV